MTTPHRRCALRVCYGEELKFCRSRGPGGRGTKAARSRHFNATETVSRPRRFWF